MSLVKDPQAVLDFAWDWSAWLAASETISTATVTPATSGITVDSTAHTSSTVTAWLSGGTTGATYALTCHVVTNQGRADDRTIRVSVRDR